MRTLSTMRTSERNLLLSDFTILFCACRKIEKSKMFAVNWDIFLPILFANFAIQKLSLHSLYVDLLQESNTSNSQHW